MFTDMKDFNYEAPQMYYDKQSGEIKIKEKETETKKKYIRNIDELEKEKKALYAEIGLSDEGKSKNNETEEELAEKIKKAADRMVKEFDIDPSNFYVFSRDFMRVDVGLMI